jgi:epoxide hydrolase-like predicted phosphatase
MIKSVIFDWGGVLIDNPRAKMISYCANYLNVSEEEFKQVHYKYKPDFQKGNITEDEFWQYICADLNISKPTVTSLWGTAFRAAYVEKKEVFSLAVLLRKKHYKIGFLSNTERPGMDFFHEQQYNLFDVTVFSCAEGVKKPEKRIYEIALTRLGVHPRAVVFIDDTEENIVGARRVGLHTILFESVHQLRKELDEFI